MSVVIDLDLLPEGGLPAETAIAAITLAKLSAGLQTAVDPAERAARAGRLQRAEAAWEPLPFDAGAARRYGQLLALVLAAPSECLASSGHGVPGGLNVGVNQLLIAGQ